MKREYKEITFDQVTFNPASPDLSIKEQPLDSRIFRLAVAGFLVVIAVVLSGVFFLGTVKGDFYRNRSFANVNKILIQPAPRGIIFDRYGKPLVSNVPSLALHLRPLDLVKNNELEPALSLLESVGLSRADFYRILEENDLQTNDLIVLKKDISNSEAIKIASSGLSSLVVVHDFKRAFHPAFSHLVGYTNLSTRKEVGAGSFSSMDTVGRSGLEKYYDGRLRGANGKTVIYQNAKGEKLEERAASEPKVGEDLTTTVDAEFQEYFYRRLDQRLKSLGRSRGAGMAINPQNGEVLAMISMPGFSPTNLAEALRDEIDRPISNRLASGLYSPGSTIKPIIAVAALKEEIVTPADKIFSSGQIELPNPYYPDKPSIFKDWKAHGWVDLYSAIARSSNVYFYEVGGGFEGQQGLGIAKIREYFSLFGLDKKTGLAFPGEANGSLVPEKDWKKERSNWRVGDTYNVSIGQGKMLVTPIGLLNAIASIVNGGELYKPSLVPTSPSKILKDNSYLKPQFDEVVKGMLDTVSKPYGSAYLLRDIPMKIAAKTGSVQIDNNTKTNALFVGCGPIPLADKPSVCVLVLVEDAKEGSLNALPIAYDVMKWYYENRIK